MEIETSINDSDLTQSLIDYYANKQQQTPNKTTTTIESSCTSANNKDQEEVNIQEAFNDYNNNEISISKIVQETNAYNQLEQDETNIENNETTNSIFDEASDEDDEETNQFLILNDLVNKSSKSGNKRKKNNTNEVESHEQKGMSESTVEESQIILDSNKRNETVADNNNDDNFHEYELESLPRPTRKRCSYSFDSESTSASSHLTTHYKQIRMIKTYNVITTFVFKETFDLAHMSDMVIETEYSQTSKELVEQNTKCKLITREELDKLKAEKPLKSQLIETNSEDETEDSDYEPVTKPKRIKKTVDKKKPLKKEKSIQKSASKTIPVSRPTFKIAFRNFEPPKVKRNRLNQVPIIINDINSDVRFTRSMAKSNKGEEFPLKKAKSAPKVCLRKISVESNQTISIDSTSESDNSCQSSTFEKEIEMPKITRNNPARSAKSPYRLKNLEIRLERLSPELLMNRFISSSKPVADQSNREVEVTKTISRRETLKVNKNPTQRKKSITIREILTPKFQPNEKAFALCTDGNFYPCIVKSFCQNGIYKCAFLYESEENLSDLYEIKEDKLIALEQLREHDSLMVYLTDDRLKYEKAVMCDPSQLTVRISSSGIRKTTKFCNMALFKENNIEEIIHRLKSK